MDDFPDNPDREGKHDPPASRRSGPYAPPLPTEAERTEGGEPMAVANDKATLHGESFLPTTQSKDAYDRDVAKRYETVPGSAAGGKEGGIPDTVNPIDAERRAGSPEAEKPETQEQILHPPGYTETDERGYKRLKWDDDEAADKGE